MKKIDLLDVAIIVLVVATVAVSVACYYIFKQDVTILKAAF